MSILKFQFFAFLSSSSSTLAMKMVGSWEKKVSGCSVRGGVQYKFYVYSKMIAMQYEKKNIFFLSIPECSVKLKTSRELCIVVNKFLSLIPFCHRKFCVVFVEWEILAQLCLEIINHRSMACLNENPKKNFSELIFIISLHCYHNKQLLT